MLDPSIRLRNAIIEGNLPITKRLLHRYPDLWLNIDPFHNGWSNLHYASYHGNYLICFHLVTLRRNSDNFTSKDESTAFRAGDDDEYATDQGSRQEDGIDMLTFDGLSVLHLPSINHKSQTLHYLLKEYPGKLWLNQKGGPELQTPLHYTCKYGFKEGLTLLLEFEADYLMADGEGNNCLHLCFQYGHFNCIESLYNFISSKCTTKEELEDVIVKFEVTANNKSWKALEVASSFEISKQYKHFRSTLLSNFDERKRLENELELLKSTEKAGHHQDFPSLPPLKLSHSSSFSPLVQPAGMGIFEGVTSQDFSPSNSAISTFSIASEASTSPQENRILASPIVSVSAVKKDSNDMRTRAYSLSLPSETDKALSPVKRPHAVRQRSNTAAVTSPTSSSSTTAGIRGNSIRAPHTPIVQTNLAKTPSLKSIAISPSVRNWDANIISSENKSSPTSKYGSLTKTPSSTQQWIPGNGSNYNASGNSPTSSLSTSSGRSTHRGSISYNSPNSVAYTSSPVAGGIASTQPQVLDFLKSSNSSSQKPNMSRKSSSSSSTTSSIAAKLAFNGTSSSRSSIITFNDSDGSKKTSTRSSPTKETPPKIRRARSSATIEPVSSTVSTDYPSKSKWASTSSFSNLSGSSSEDLKSPKPHIHSITFSRLGRQ
ncbi:hypothetical protein CLIB1423_02S05996 [[Candida] railenensis]|uniref:Target of rapamycin complex 2 subunit AVO2 n=1 Tax=[Candida] railenensis TaxID=45579 RepID=A0A9P0QLQ0_9ASCO|nr:hypothetical protein CLIB1423_02S05996 [[Candida] railenensis]